MKQNKIKLLILGESSVGKTALLNRLDRGEFVQTISSVAMANAMRQMKIENTMINLSIWDTVGQEKYRSITFNLYKNSQGIALAFDLTNTKSFNTLENWMKLINENINPGFQIVLIGTKCDLVDNIEVTKENINSFLAKYENKFDYFETSSLTNVNVIESFENLAQKIYHANKEMYVPLDIDKPINQKRDPNGDSIIISPKPIINVKKKCCS